VWRVQTAFGQLPSWGAPRNLVEGKYILKALDGRVDTLITEFFCVLLRVVKEVRKGRKKESKSERNVNKKGGTQSYK
jgi:hypothetical protein